MLSFDPAGTQIILIGTTKCPHDPTNLPDLPSVANNIAELNRIFRDPDIIGLNEENLEVILDPPSSTQLLIRLSKAAKKARDTFLIYYAGHGIKAALSDGLFLATAETTQDECHLDGVEFQKVRRVIFDAPAAKKILIFDCCYSGEIFAEMGGGDASVVSNSIAIKGVYSIASAPRNSFAYAPPSEKFTAFTKELVSVLGEGVDISAEYITLDRMYDEVRSRISAMPNLPVPQKKVELDVDEFVIARNVRYALNPEAKLRKLEQRYNILLEEGKHREAARFEQIKDLERRMAKASADAREAQQKLAEALQLAQNFGQKSADLAADLERSRQGEAKAWDRVQVLEDRLMYRSPVGTAGRGAAPGGPAIKQNRRVLISLIAAVVLFFVILSFFGLR